ncbi:hypothetical protein P171DRAFT_395514 [Karstenula rhodostoma CBS 690.94]|uniref:MARVEL domain-containing protein n=1 Tax=Karstenula rhodostoma CBS 690.94 TaxID=1392251 RepID=A0A9P4P9B7_9PLEO|nr:hypothetical protein P171DRAFT_395514 [Karstenula rhodostoma CBS 690.94]
MSSPSPILNFALRGFQVLFAAVVLGLSVGMIKGQGPGLNSPISLRYTAFVGGVSFLTAIIGIAAEWISVLQGMVGLVIDALVTLLNIAGGVLLAIQIGVPKCSDASDENRLKLYHNHLFNGGCYKDLPKVADELQCWNGFDGREGQLNARCKEAQADTVFLFFTVAILLVSATMTFLRTKKGY